ncbi:unnamed protein product, partial [Owenia fusiformis]
ENHYGEACNFCLESDDCTGHYTCNFSDGSKICMSNWNGTDCNIWTGQAYTCLHFTGSTKTDDVRGLWDGTITCPSGGPFVFTLGLLSPRATRVEGYFQLMYLNGTNITSFGVNGTYSLSRMSFTLIPVYGSSIILPINGIIGQIDDDADNMSAEIYSRGSRCKLDGSRRTAFIDACQNNASCVRTGENIDDFYCCCEPGFKGERCQIEI